MSDFFERYRGLERPFFLLVIAFVFISFSPLFADEIHLKNGDRVTGDLLYEKEGAYVVQTAAMGMITIQTGSVEQIVPAETSGDHSESEKAPAAVDAASAPAKREVNWKVDLEAGLDRSYGNTKTSELHGAYALKRKTKKNEFDVKGAGSYSERDRKMDSRKYSGSVRYAFSFGSGLKWYNFYKAEGDHDRFANINYRYTPMLGIGYWFWDEPDLKLMAEIGGGMTHTDFRDATKARNEGILAPRFRLEVKLVGRLRGIDEITVYPSLTEPGDYRYHWENILENPITEHIALRFKLIDDFNADPGDDTSRHDTRLMSSLAYTF